MDTVQIGSLSVSRLILGGNPFSGHSHQSREKSWEMRRYYTAARIKETFAQSEGLGINTFLGRADAHIVRVLLEYWQEGGTIQWIAQTCPEYVSIGRSIASAIEGGAKACYLHGGQMDRLLARGELDEIPDAVAEVRDAGLPVGIAGHNPQVFQWAEESLDVDFYMCSYYNPSRRDEHGERISGREECFSPEHRAEMVRVISRLSKPAIHYKVLAAGRNDPREAFAFVAQHLRPQDAVCVGVYTKDHRDMLEDDVRWLNLSLTGGT